MIGRWRDARKASVTSILGRGIVSILLALPLAAEAADLGVKFEPGVAFPLTDPQSDRFDIGGGAALKLMYGLGRYADATAGVSFIGLPTSSDSPSSETGTAWGYGGGLRLKGPHDSNALRGIAPWVDGDALYVRTGSLNRFGFAAGAGLGVPVDAARRFWVGPFVRYQQIFGRHGGSDGRDAKVLLAGLSFELGSSPVRTEVALQPNVAPAPVPAQATAPEAAAAAVSEPADRDDDGTSDKDDLCPDVAGPTTNRGCPVYEKVVVKPDVLELKEKIQFAKNSPRIEQASHPVLDETVKLLQENRGFRVQLQGHASSEGAEAHNQTLSEQRAQAVLDYLVQHGVSGDRLSSKGFSSSVPIGPNDTAAGRESNRRVEFVVQFLIENSESGK